MKVWSIALKAFAAMTTTKWTTCVKVVRRDGVELGLTKHDRKLTIDGLDYLPKHAISVSDVASYSNLDADNLSANGLKTGTTITDDDLRAGRWDGFYFEVFRVNWGDLTMGTDKIRAGHLGPSTMHKQEFELELIGLLEAYGTSIGEQTSPGCRASLGDARCKVDLEGSPGLTVAGTVFGIVDEFEMADAARTEPDGFFTEGTIEFTGPTGNALVGLRYSIKEYQVGTWKTKTPVAYDATGAEYVMVAGCDRLYPTCRDRFHNTLNFRGEPNLKGIDKLLQVGRSE